VRPGKTIPLLISAAIALPVGVGAYDINDQFSVGGILAGVYQYHDLRGDSGADDAGRGAVVFQPEIRFTPTENDEFFSKLGFAAGNGLNEVSPFVVAPWAADLEDDVREINGRNRDFLLTAWYKHRFEFKENNTLSLTGGLIDTTDYLDDNAFSNDEYTQFMSAALVNAPNGFFPSYDIGGVAEWDVGRFSLQGLVMSIGRNDDGKAFTFYGVELSYTLNMPLGEGTYRLIVDGTSKAFLDPSGTGKERRAGAFLSFDQELGEILGAFLRIGIQDDEAAINFDALYSGGLNIEGTLWGREEDNIGIGYAYLEGGNLNIDRTQVAEVYARFQLNRFFAFTADLQYMQDDLVGGSASKGFIYGLRLTAAF
jgi:hypothetical protein